MFSQEGIDDEMVTSVTATAGKRERADTTANHARIIDAARTMFAAQGFDVEMREIAARAGVAVGTLYRHFTNRDDLLRAVLAHTFADAIAHFHAAAALPDAQAALRAFLSAAGEIHQQSRSLFTAMHDSRFNKLCADQGMSKKAFGEQIIGEIAALVARGVRDGVFRADLDPEITAGALMGSMIAFEVLTPRRSYDAVADALADLYLKPLTATEPAVSLA